MVHTQTEAKDIFIVLMLIKNVISFGQNKKQDKPQT